MVAVKRHSSDYAKELATCRHENLLAVLELYKHDRASFFVVTDYTVATLKQSYIVICKCKTMLIGRRPRLTYEDA
jgi:hypothetical protein